MLLDYYYLFYSDFPWRLRSCNKEAPQLPTSGCFMYGMLLSKNPSSDFS